jgi:Caspase domain
MKRALLIGIDQYPDPRNNLNSCVADTLKFKDMLMSNYGFAPGDIRLLHNNYATLSNVRTGLDDLTRNAASGDEIVYFESSHGYRYPDGDTMVEVLCLYDAFLTDTEFAQRTQVLPPGVLTVVLDACHSGGMNKIFFSPDGPAVARVKVWQPPVEDAIVQIQQMQQITHFKFFGRSSVAEPADVVKAFSIGRAVTTAFVAGPSVNPQLMARWNRKDFQAGDVELNGALFSACQADQTAAAGTPATAGLSAFTYALTDQLNTAISLRSLCALTVARLQALHMSQTPEVHTPVGQPQLADQTFIALQPAQGPSIVPVQPPSPQNIPDALASLFGELFRTSPQMSSTMH